MHHATDGGSPIKVSVVVPVYNPGRYLTRCFKSIVRQSLPPDEYEAIFVDDGSTDGTSERLDRLAKRHRNVRVIHQENSGWPGKPRNVGIAAARGRYVQFVDNDDALGPEALERLYAMAERNRSDVVIGKMAGHGRTVPKNLFLESRDRATLADTPLLESLTPHKLFRRSFIERHGLRFPEGRRRLEDHVFVVRSYFLAAVVSVLSDYICYYHFRRDDGSNAGLRRLDPRGYYGNLREVLAIIEEHTEPGPFRNRLLERFARAELLGRLRERGFLQHPADYRAALFKEIRSVIDDHIPVAVDDLLAPLHRTQMALVRAGRLDLLVDLAQAEVRVAAAASVGQADPSDDGALRLSVEAGMDAGEVPLALERSGRRFLLRVPPSVEAAAPPSARTVRNPLDTVARVAVRRRDDSAELIAPAALSPVLVEGDGGSAAVRIGVDSTIDPRTLDAGRPLWTGTWQVVVRVEQLGLVREARLARPEGTLAHPIPLISTDRLTVTAEWIGEPGHLVLAVTRRSHPIARRLPPPLRRFARRAYRRVRSALEAG